MVLPFISWLCLNPFTVVYQETFKQSYTRYAILLMSRFWHICFELGPIPSEIINQSRTVISIAPWLSHTTVINVLIVDSAKLLCNLCIGVTVLPFPSALLTGHIYPSFHPIIKHILPFQNMIEHLSIWIEHLSGDTVSVLTLRRCQSMMHHRLLNLSVRVALHFNHPADIHLSLSPCSFFFHRFWPPSKSLFWIHIDQV